MAIKLIANYSKRLGLPGYSSHQFSVSVETELNTTDDVAKESGKLYQRLQSTVDEQMLNTGFVPPTDYGLQETQTNVTPMKKDGEAALESEPVWRCSSKQRDLILKLVEEHKLDKNDIETLATERFGKGVRLLNKVEASGLIDELLEIHGGSKRQGSRRNGSAYGGGANGRRVA